MNAKVKKYALSFVLVMAVLIAFGGLAVMSVSATTGGCASETKFNGTLNGSIYYKTAGEFGSKTLTVEFNDVPDETIEIARVYTGVWGGSPGKGGKFNITINGQASADYQACDTGDQCNVVNTDECHDYVTGCGVHFITYNATGNISGGGNNNITVRTWDGGCMYNWDGRIYLVALLVVYKNTSTLESMTYWINEGSPSMIKDSGCANDCDEINIYFNGSTGNPNLMKYWTFGFPHNADVDPKLNGHNIGAQDFTDPSYFLYRWDNIPTTYLNQTGDINLLNYSNTDAGYERVHSAVIMLSNQTGSDLTVKNIEFPDAMRPNKNHTINATIKNVGNVNVSNAFNVKLYVNEVLNGTKSIQELNASKNKTVNFTVNLSKGCHEFKVVADADGAIEELNEYNNASSTKKQVGYVVVVKSDGGFDDLVNESKNGTLGSGNVTKVGGDTYYIRNFTIENCAGKGISIENTNAKFVIRNCTVHSCKGAGMYLNTVTNGKINDSTVKDNLGNGIRIQNSTHVNVTNNTVTNNTGYGIDLYPRILKRQYLDDCKFDNVTNNNITENLYGIELIGCNCTVKDNNVTNSTQYGIYVYGNYSNITNNNVTNSSGYGVKLFNSTGNYVYDNNFTDNRLSNKGHQAWDNRTTNYWNTSAKGNYWSDRVSNSGCPNNYSIDGGNNKDYHPEGPTTASHTCDFSTGAGVNKWAYKDEVAGTPTTNNVPSEEFSSGEYTNIEADDNNDQSNNAQSDEYNAAHRFNFSISGNPSFVTKINVTWNGKGLYNPGACGGSYDGAILYIWNKSKGASGGYDEWDDNSDENWVYLTGENASSAINYISSSNNVTILVKQKGITLEDGNCLSTIKTDYVKLNYTITCQS